eukprot:TRINITY_DN1888_c0_g1_i1.p1 TRINITY_DN1888_c0_g1~~TRINITY_DN1888_c0_g1_i1.p1  ORF type:complete len:521 (-),score=235.08 TRINITY_DN1888_c0_g1_i1:106-1668(-)
MATDKTKRYDRQLRLWGEEGQEKLETSKLLLIGANATGTELLKNLVLPGIGSFTLLDNKKVSAADTGNNFFVTTDSIGQSRAAVTSNLLQELNELVSANFVDEDPEKLIAETPEFFTKFTVVIVCELNENSLRKLAEQLYNAQIPLVIVQTCGFVASLRLVLREHTVLDSKPETPLEDLRLNAPFVELSDFVNSFDFDGIPANQHSHIPYLVILVKAITEWRKKHNGTLPQTRPEKTEFQNFVRAMARTPDEENFKEAAASCFKAYVIPRLPYNTAELFEHEKCKNLTPNSSRFWIIVRALKDFYYSDGQNILPLIGTIPDMHSDTEKFVKLQQIFHHKATQDFERVFNNVKSTTTSLNLPEISPEVVKSFCKNSNYLQLLSNKRLEDEYTSTTQLFELDNSDDNLHEKAFYLGLRAVTRFQVEYKRYPGENDPNADLPLFQNVLRSLLQQMQYPVDIVPEQIVQELCRSGGAELHNIASFMGGVGAQEVIKILTNQYIPLNNAFIYNGLTSTGSNFNIQ